MDQTMTQADEIKRLKRQLEKTRTERDEALKKLGRAAEAAKKDDAKLNDNARKIMYLERQQRALVALSNGYGLLGTDHDTMWSHVSELDRIIETPKLEEDHRVHPRAVRVQVEIVRTARHRIRAPVPGGRPAG